MWFEDPGQFNDQAVIILEITRNFDDFPFCFGHTDHGKQIAPAGGVYFKNGKVKYFVIAVGEMNGFPVLDAVVPFQLSVNRFPFS